MFIILDTKLKFVLILTQNFNSNLEINRYNHSNLPMLKLLISNFEIFLTQILKINKYGHYNLIMLNFLC